MSSIIIEFLKLRRSASWGVVLVLPTVSVLCACVLVRPTDWQLLWVRSIGFYGMVLLPVSLGVLASLVWRVEHQGSNGLALMSAPVCALQSGLSAFTRSFAVPVAIGLALTGAGTTALLLHIPAAWLLPHALVTRTTQIGATSEGATLVFAAQELTWTSAAVTVGISAALSAVVVLATSVALERSDTRGG